MIEIKNITKSFKKQKVLQGLDLTCETGKIQALLGANGAGKSTLINIVSGLMENNDGEFLIDNEQITINSYKYRIKVGYVFEKPIYIDKLSAKEYLTFVAKMYKLQRSEYTQRIEELLAFFELPTDNKKYIESYSKGMKNKVSLAAALIHHPKYLILDEPFDGVDFVSIQKITRVFKDLAKKGVTILIASHQYDVVAELCDNFALLKSGKIIFNLTMPELEEQANKQFKNNPTPVKSYLESLMSSEQETSLTWN
jgi:ABC-2 type transport system ATP-binding protein